MTLKKLSYLLLCILITPLIIHARQCFSPTYEQSSITQTEQNIFPAFRYNAQNELDPDDLHALSTLLEAIRNHNTRQTLTILLEHPYLAQANDMNPRDSKNYDSPLRCAVMMNNIHAAQLCLYYGATPNQWAIPNKNTLVEHCVYKNKFYLLKLLLDAKADVNIGCPLPLRTAVVMAKVDYVTLLLNYKACPSCSLSSYCDSNNLTQETILDILIKQNAVNHKRHCALVEIWRILEEWNAHTAQQSTLSPPYTKALNS